jgi:hypothetical protein
MSVELCRACGSPLHCDLFGLSEYEKIERIKFGHSCGAREWASYQADLLKQVLAAVQYSGSKKLLRQVNEPLPDGCYCQPGQCMAPVIMGRQMPCRDPEKAAQSADDSAVRKTE